MIRRITYIALFLLGIAPLTFAQEAADFFAQKCKICHTIGGGRRAGPDLKDVTKQKDRTWLETFIQNPKAVIDSGDPFAVQLQQESRGLVMPTVAGITPQLAKSLVDFIEHESRESEPVEKQPPQEPERKKSAEMNPASKPSTGEKEPDSGVRERRHREDESAGRETEEAERGSARPDRSPSPTEAQESPSDRPFTADEVALGRGIFTGSHKLSGGGPACISCHTLGTLGGFGGGRLGPDLSGLYDRFGGREGLNTWLSAAPSPTMQAIFEKRPLQPEEIRLLTALFENESQLPRGAGTASQARFVAASFAGLCGALALVGWIWRGRFRNVRRSLIAAAKGIQ